MTFVLRLNFFAFFHFWNGPVDISVFEQKSKEQLSPHHLSFSIQTIFDPTIAKVIQSDKKLNLLRVIRTNDFEVRFRTKIGRLNDFYRAPRL